MASNFWASIRDASLFAWTPDGAFPEAESAAAAELTIRATAQVVRRKLGDIAMAMLQ
jgi:hypothetical protein